jgi:lipoprotein-releasing system permease protein
MWFELFVAARYLRAKRRQAVVGIVTAIAVLGVAAGVAALIIALAITAGMERDLLGNLVETSGQVQLMATNGLGIYDWRPLLARLSKLPHIVAASPELAEEVEVARGARPGGALIEGILPQYEKHVTALLAHATSGSVQALEPLAGNAQTAAPPPIVLGNDLADAIGARIGDVIKVISPQGEMTPMGIIPQWLPFRLAGTYHTGFYEFDDQSGLVRLSDAQRTYGEPDLITVINFKVDDPYHAPQIAKEIEQAAGKKYQTTNWIEQNHALSAALSLEQTVTFIVIALIVMVAALNILTGLTMMVMEKTRDIAVMMSFGVQPGQVRRIFLMQGFLISVVGTALGLLLGYLGAWAGAHYHIPLPSDVYAIDTLPFAIRPWDGIVVAAVSICISLLATLYPSHAASRILPAEALRYE